MLYQLSYAREAPILATLGRGSPVEKDVAPHGLTSAERSSAISELRGLASRPLR